MADIPEILKSGEIARLIPVVADSRKEQRVASVFLATLSAVPDLAEALLGSVGQRVGRRTTINSFTEVVFKDKPQDLKDRPDGLLIVDRGRSTWSALIEAKIGNSKLEPGQIERYAQLARNNKIDSVITISNEFVARPDHSPVSIPKMLLRKVSLYHWSWKFILTEAILLRSRAAATDPDQAFLLREFIRFLSHDSVGVSGFTQMPPEWKEIISQLQSGAALHRNSPAVAAVIRAWHQEVRDLALRMSHNLSVNVQTKLSRAHASDPGQRFKDDCAQLSEKQLLALALQVPDAAADMNVVADLKARSIRVGMEVDAPQDKQRVSARLNWLLRQMKEADPENLFVRIIWPTRAQDVVCPLASLREGTTKVGEDSSQAPRAFEVFYATSDSRRFSGRKTFVEELENAVPIFYERVGQYLQPWRPKPPKPTKTAESQEPHPREDSGDRPIQPPSTGSETQQPPPAGNLHTALLEVPSFLKRP